MKPKTVKLFAAITFVGVLIVNYLANALPLNGIMTGAVSDSYANLFAPAGITFAIWGVIYLLLGLYIIYQFGVFGNINHKKELIEKIGIYFIITSVANMLWIFAWHFDYLALSVILMLTMLISLIKISNMLFSENKFSSKDYFFIKLPFSIYFGWITVATIANITTFLVSINWDGFGFTNQFWTIIVLIVGTLIGLIVGLRKKDAAYILVLLWAYGGILLKHVTTFKLEYSGIITTSLLCMALFALVLGFLLKKYFIINEVRI